MRWMGDLDQLSGQMLGLGGAASQLWETFEWKIGQRMYWLAVRRGGKQKGEEHSDELQ